MLLPAQLQALAARLRAVEERTGVQVVVAAIERADVYHGLRWRAFAFGVAISALLVALTGTLRTAWIPAHAAFWAASVILGAGLLCALVSTLSPPVARLFLEPLRTEAEVRECGASIFLERALFATRGRTAVLLLACRFERLALVRADSGFHDRVTAAQWRALEDTMSAHLRTGRAFEGILAGLDALERLLEAQGFAATAGAANELPDCPLAGSGAP